MPQVPVYNRQQGLPAQADAVRGNPAAMAQTGAGLGEASAALMGVGDRLAEANKRLNDRRDAIHRARDLTSVARQADDLFTKFSTEDDFSDPDAVDRFGKAVDDLLGKSLSEHKGSEESRARMAARFEALRQQAGARASAFAVQQQRKLLEDQIGTRIGELAGGVAADPKGIDAAFRSLDADLADMAGALTPDEERDKRRAGRSLILKSAIQTLLDKDGVAEAKSLLDGTQGVNEILRPEESIKIRSAIAAKETALSKAANAGNMKVREAEQILGRRVTEDERKKLAGVAPPSGSLPEKITQLETALGRPLTSDEIKRAGGLSSGDFGAGLTGRALEIITDDATAFAAGTLSPAEERRFLSAVTQYTQPTTFANPTTGQMETRSPTLPPFVQEALRRRGMEPPRNVAQPGQETQPGGPRMSGGERTTAEAAMGGKTVFDMAGDIAGPVPAIGEGLSRTPGVGSIVQAPQMTQARNFTSLISRDLIRVLQNNPRYAEGERQAIEKEAGIDPSIFDTPDAFRNRMIAIDDALAKREQNAYNTATNATVSLDERKQALNVLNGIVNFRAALGVPPRVKNAEEAKKLPPGSLFIAPDGRILRNTIRGGAGGGTE